MHDILPVSLLWTPVYLKIQKQSVQKLSTLSGSIACKTTLAAVSGNNGFPCDFISVTLFERSFGPLLLPLCFISFH